MLFKILILCVKIVIGCHAHLVPHYEFWIEMETPWQDQYKVWKVSMSPNDGFNELQIVNEFQAP